MSLGNTMKKVLRNPMRFDMVHLLALQGQERHVSLHDPQTIEQFLGQARISLEDALRDGRLLHGQRTQAMFEALVTSLGRVQILKQEDAGAVYVADDRLQIPDFRLVLEPGQQVLIEVKNCYAVQEPDDTLKLPAKYLAGLRRYADMMDCELKIAVYWAKWNQWTLVAPSAFQLAGKFGELTMQNAHFANEMSRLGDLLIGTQYPLVVKFIADETKDRTIADDGMVELIVGAVDLFCAGRPILDSQEQAIAFYLMLYGGWHEEENVLTTDNQLDAIEFRYVPLGESEQDFAIVGSLSSMFSSFYNAATLNETGVDQIRAETTPDWLGQLIPNDYHGQALPLWRFVQRPSFVAAAGSWQDIDTDKVIADIYASRGHSSSATSGR
jgi:hypothetical protein